LNPSRMENPTICFLEQVEAGHVLHLDTNGVILGRGSSTFAISDKRCSRTHAKVIFNPEERVCTITATGTNPVSIIKHNSSEKLVRNGVSASLTDGEFFCLLPGVTALKFKINISGGGSQPKSTQKRPRNEPEKVFDSSQPSSKKYRILDSEEDQSKEEANEKENVGSLNNNNINAQKDDIDKTATDDHRNIQTNTTVSLPPCRYGAKCYRKNPQHFKEFSHPQQDETAAQQHLSSSSPSHSSFSSSSSSSSLSSSIPPDFKHRYATPPTLGWTVVEDSMFVLDGPEIKPSTKIAAFDMDSTLIITESGRKFPRSRNDWQWMLPGIPNKLKALNKQGWKVVIFSNQAGLDKGKQKPADIQGKVEDMGNELGFPLQCFIAAAEDHWRKPRLDMWYFMCKYCNGGHDVDMANSFYCGDAAGRMARPGHKKDFSCSDRKFAMNVGLPFHTPEAYFLGEAEAPFSWDGVNPKELVAQSRTTSLFGEVVQKSKQTGKVGSNKLSITANHQELVIFVGYPASGKSTFARRYFEPTYVRVNRDILKSKEKCLKVCEEALEQGKSVLVDNTNPAASTRKQYISLAAKRNIPCRCFHFTASVELAKHLNMYREHITGGKSKHVPRIGYAVFTKNFEEPTLEEGFIEIRKVNFIPQFDSREEEAAFLEFT
jgi:bifunctional polynucleotide phosphatase/kinase